MDLVVAFAAGALAMLLVARALGRPPLTFTFAPQQQAAEKLQALSATLANIGEASSHPRDLQSNPTFREAVAILTADTVPMSVVTDYAIGANWILATAAFAALCERPDRKEAAPLLERHFRHLSPWPMYYALQYFATLDVRPPLGSFVLDCPEYWIDNPIVPGILAEHFGKRAALGDAASFGDALTAAPQPDLANTEKLLRKIDHPAAQSLTGELTAWRNKALDRSYLQTFGRFVEAVADEQLLLEHEGLAEELASAQAAVLNAPHRSVLVVGDARAGKTSFLMLLAKRVASQGWSVFEAGATSLMAGQMYFGQLEERLQRLTSELAVDKRVIWYVPDFLELAGSGGHRGRTATLLDQMLPALEARQIVMLSETTPSALTTVLARRPSLRSAVEIVRLPSLSDAQVTQLAHDFAQRVSAGSGIAIEPEIVDTAVHLARHYLGTGQMPGAALDLMKLTAQRVAAHARSRMERADVLASLSQMTGMPQLVLDDRERVDLSSLRRFFLARVMGQDEAVDVVVDRIAMLKAGLTDPAKPVAVFLFAGPTGTGKTELAKTLAAFLFGSADRLIRLDMSEFQAVESTRKILGDPNQDVDMQALTHRVRRQPFSVVLLDEFEKAHPNAWDLFLQVFDDGRLTDSAGHTVDFRHCIIILTSNLGATVQHGAGLGFVSASGTFSPDHVIRAVHQAFRPEFVNRLDAVIVFRPLTRELMRGILSKELAEVLERRGLRHREWAVEWEASALAFLLDKGFSPTMGARPLKRAIDRYLLAPLAATLVEHRFPQGEQFLFVRSDGRAIQVEFVDPDAEPEPMPPLTSEPVAISGLPLPRLMLQATGAAEEQAALAAEMERVESRFSHASWTALETRLAAEMQHREFWDRSDRLRVLSRYALMDRVKAAAGTARGLETRLVRSAGRGGRYSRDLVSRLAAQLYVLHHGIEDALTDAPVEIALVVQPVLDVAPDAASGQWCERLFDMYRQWASRRHMQWEELPRSSPGSKDMEVVVSGFGAARILGGEVGLHVLEVETGEEAGRTVARVKVASTPDALPEVPAEKYAAVKSVLSSVPASASVVRRYRLGASPLVRDVSHGWRTGRCELVLQGQFDLLADVLPAGN